MESDLAQLLLNNQEPKQLLREDLDRWLTHVSKDQGVMCRSGRLLKVHPLTHHSEEHLSHRSSQFKNNLRNLLSLSRLLLLPNRRNSLQKMVVPRKRKEPSLSKTASVQNRMIGQFWLTMKNQKRKKKKFRKNQLLQPAIKRQIVCKQNLKKLKWKNLQSQRLKLSRMNRRNRNFLILAMMTTFQKRVVSLPVQKKKHLL